GISLVNAPGLVDAGYRGEVKVLLLNNDPAEVFRINPGDRIAQMVVIPLAAVEPVATDSLSETERGEGGFGSSGR
nr:dUTP diphosphatase [Solirubrobacterales bacterium]